MIFQNSKEARCLHEYLKHNVENLQKWQGPLFLMKKARSHGFGFVGHRLLLRWFTMLTISFTNPHEGFAAFAKREHRPAPVSFLLVSIVTLPIHNKLESLGADQRAQSLHSVVLGTQSHRFLFDWLLTLKARMLPA